jgi:hypothetical protein
VMTLLRVVGTGLRRTREGDLKVTSMMWDLEFERCGGVGALESDHVCRCGCDPECCGWDVVMTAADSVLWFPRRGQREGYCDEAGIFDDRYTWSVGAVS